MATPIDEFIRRLELARDTEGCTLVEVSETDHDDLEVVAFDTVFSAPEICNSQPVRGSERKILVIRVKNVAISGG